MKTSRFNLILERSQFSYWYNTFSGKFFRISLNLGKKLQSLMQNIDDCSESVPFFFIEKLKSAGFIIDNEVDELNNLRKLNNDAIQDKNYFLILLPTLNCNYHCWYCIQSHINSKMSDDVVNRIKRHIDYMIEKEKIKSLHIDWFGGEPFMYFNDVIVPITKYCIEVCERDEIPFLVSTTTNGYYLDEPTIKTCKELSLEHYQITLDGDGQFHDKVKFTEGCESTFKHVLSNINNLLRHINKAVVTLRINYTHKNLTKDIVKEVNKFIDRDNRCRVIITPRKVWQEDVNKNFDGYLSQILNDFKGSGYHVEYWNPVKNYISCYANKRYYNAINYNGNVVKCTACNDLYKDEPMGILCDDGRIEWQSDIMYKYQEPSFNNDECLGCNKLPICMGICPREHVNGKRYCKETYLDTSFGDSIIAMIDRSYDENNE